ncbi:MAG: biopolymer transporter ExbD [Flavisolibacter sp.]|nr:biopolymer transporter ExbD [Flavisolibacter sp.]
MPSVKIPRKSTFTDMTPFVDVAFLILSFFMLATKFKPPAPIEITTPKSVSSEKLKEQDAVLIEFDSTGKVYFTMNTKTQQESDKQLKRDLITEVNKNRNLGLTEREIQSFTNYSTVGSPFSELKTLLDLPQDQRKTVKQKGIPVDSANNELTTWIGAAKVAFQGRQMFYMLKGDNKAKYPSFKGVIDAMKANEEFKYKLITDPKTVPYGTDLYTKRESGKADEE